MWGVLRLNAATRLAVGWLTKVTVPNLKSVFHGNWQLAFVNLDVSNDEEDEQGGKGIIRRMKKWIHANSIILRHKCPARRADPQGHPESQSMQEFEECSRRSLLDLCLIGSKLALHSSRENKGERSMCLGSSEAGFCISPYYIDL
ncbi:hypothetical protein SeLEV6574_g02261 [Synchytrium endobioticum]|uniref:Uncharacterized protein n=1 Tax=Synchytrium endobioticum TaxID=286115 RepID=A0A507D8V6_9FUNG|nr:hypothetical protein SeLEV6574_g02261 [Synchytrium endobioticum]